MSVFLVGNAVDADGNVVGVDDGKYKVQFEYKKEGKNTVVPLVVGEPKNIDVNPTKDFNFYIIATCIAPEQFNYAAKGVKSQTPIAITNKQKIMVGLGAPDISSSDVGRRTFDFRVGSDAPEPTELYKKFLVGNEFSVANGIHGVGEQHFTATLSVTKPDGVKTYPFTLGVAQDIDILNATKVSWNVTVESGYEFCLLRVIGSPTNITPIDNAVTWEVPKSRWLDGNDDSRAIEVKLRYKSSAKFNFGNVLQNGVAELVGDSHYNGELTLTLNEDYTKPVFYDRGAYESLTVKHNFNSGTKLDLTMYAWNRGVISVKADDGSTIIQAVFPSDVTFEPNTINYSMSPNELNPFNVADRNYVVVVDKDSPDPDPVDTSAINNNYLVTKDQLKIFEKEVNSIVLNELSYENVYWLALTSYITSIRVYPFALSPDNLDGQSEIKVRDKSISLGKVIVDDTIKVNLGNIKFTPKYENALDTLETKLSLHIPFSGEVIDINPSLVMGKTVNIQLIVVINTGLTSVNIIDETGLVIHSSTINIGSDYPFFSRMYADQITLAPVQVINNMNIAYVEVERPDYEQSKPMATHFGKIGDKKGYVEVDYIEINNQSLADEKDLLRDILKQGVYIK